MPEATACFLLFCNLTLPPDALRNSLPSREDIGDARYEAVQQSLNCNAELAKAIKAKDEQARWYWWMAYTGAEERGRFFALVWTCRTAPHVLVRRLALLKLVRLIGWERVLNGRIPGFCLD